MLKKQSPALYLVFASAVLAVTALIVGIVSCTDEGFAMNETPIIVLLTVAAVILCAALTYTTGKKGDGLIPSVLLWLMVVALAVCVCEMVMGKSQVFGTVIFSDLEKGYAPAERASNLGLVSIVLYLFSSAIASVAAFFKLSKTN